MGCRGLERAPGGETDMRGTDDFRLTGGRVYISSRRTGWLLDFSAVFAIKAISGTSLHLCPLKTVHRHLPQQYTYKNASSSHSCFHFTCRKTRLPL